MTREEAITILKDISWQMGSVKRWENIEAIDMAIEALSAEANLTCKTCADRALCIMSAPDGNWKACKDYRPSAEAVREISEDCKPLFFGVDYGKLMNKGGDDK